MKLFDQHGFRNYATIATVYLNGTFCISLDNNFSIEFSSLTVLSKWTNGFPNRNHWVHHSVPLVHSLYKAWFQFCCTSCMEVVACLNLNRHSLDRRNPTRITEAECKQIVRYGFRNFSGREGQGFFRIRGALPGKNLWNSVYLDNEPCVDRSPYERRVLPTVLQLPPNRGDVRARGIVWNRSEWAEVVKSFLFLFFESDGVGDCSAIVTLKSDVR